MNLKPILFLLLPTLPTLAQTDTTASFQMIKATVEFLASDAKTYGYGKKTTCPTCTSYPTLAQYISQNKLTKADELVAEARKQALAPNATAVTLRAFLLNRVTNGPDRIHRQKLTTFAAYKQTLDVAAGQPGGEPNAVASEEYTDDSTGIAAGSTVVPTAQTETSMLDLITLLLALLSLGASGYLFWQSRQPQSHQSTDRPGSGDLLAEVSGRVSALERERSELLRRLKSLEDSTRPMPAQQQNTARMTPPPNSAPQPVQAASNEPLRPTQPIPQVATVAPAPSATPVPAPNRVVPPTKPVDRTFYGRTADLGDGFSVGGLLNAPDRDTVFEMHTQGDGQALFQVSDNPDLQRLALSDPYSYLNDTCVYSSQPRPGARIVTERPGRLLLQGEKWAIAEKAQISFL